MEEQMILQLPDEANLQLPSPYYVNLYKDFQERILWIDGEISPDSLEYVKYIINYNREDKDIPVENRKPIKIIFFSNGGDLDVHYTLRTIIKLSTTPIIGIAVGLVASAAATIFLACHKRYALDNATFLFHKGSIRIGGNFNEVIAALEDYQDSVEELISIIINETNYNEKEVLEGIQTDWYVRAEEAKEKGVIDDIITDINIFL